MRLIDADKLKIKHFVQRGDQPIEYEGTQPVYEYTDLLAYDVDNAPTVKAIPIELIEKEMKRLDEDIKWAWYYGNTALDKMEYLKMWLTIKLEEWEKENEQNKENTSQTD